MQWNRENVKERWEQSVYACGMKERLSMAQQSCRRVGEQHGAGMAGHGVGGNAPGVCT